MLITSFEVNKHASTLLFLITLITHYIDISKLTQTGFQIGLTQKLIYYSHVQRKKSIYFLTQIDTVIWQHKLWKIYLPVSLNAKSL